MALLAVLTVAAFAQKGKKDMKISVDVRSLEASVAGAKNLLELRKDTVFMSKLKKVIAQADANSAYVIDKYSILVYSGGLKSNVEDALAKMPQAVKNSETGLRVLDKYYRVRGLEVGAKVPDFTCSTPDGKQVNFYAFIKGKKCVILDFWSSWCSWCRKESPNVKKVCEQYRGKDFDVISVSFDTKKDDWVKAIKDDGTDWMQVSDLQGIKGHLYAWYDLNGIPAIFLIDGEGRIIAKGLRGQVIEDIVKETLNKQ
jgi:peroxiredoxin